MRDREGEPEAADARPEESERERDKERLLHYTPSCLSVPYIPACVWPVYSPAIHKARTFVVFFSPPLHMNHTRVLRTFPFIQILGANSWDFPVSMKIAN